MFDGFDELVMMLNSMMRDLDSSQSDSCLSLFEFSFNYYI